MYDAEYIATVKILDREYKVKCQPEETHDLQNSARYVDEQMRKIRQNVSIGNTERVAIVTALNMGHEMMQLKKQKNQHVDTLMQRVQQLQEKIQNSLASIEQIAV